MKTGLKWMTVLTLIASSFGCVSQTERDRLQVAYRRAQEQIEELKGRLEEAQARIAALESSGRVDPQLLQDLENARSQNASLAAKLTALEERIRNMGIGGPIQDPMLDQALRDLVEANPDLMTYDADRGMIKLKSDLTFALGSTQVNAAAKAGLGKLAQILNRQDAARYAVRVVGHTDAVPVRNPANVQRYGDNWGLSAARAIAVMREMKGAGVDEKRFIVSGRGQWEPVAPNGPKGAQPANRRVEIFLLPMPADAPAPAAAEEPAAASTADAVADVIADDPPETAETDVPARFK